MSANFTLLAQEELRGARAGIYFGPRSLVLLRRDDKWLIWTPGHSTWSGTGQPWTYAAASLSISDPRRHGGYRTICRGGRLKQVLRGHAEAIDAEFGEGISQLIEPDKTLVI